MVTRGLVLHLVLLVFCVWISVGGISWLAAQ